MQEKEQETKLFVDRRNSVPTSSMERHAQTIIGAILIGLIAWVGMSVTSSKEAIAKLEVQQQVMQSDVQEMKTDLKVAVRDRFTATQARQQEIECRGRMQEIERRIMNLEEAKQ